MSSRLHVVRLDQVDSTQEYARSAFEAGVIGQPSWVLARRQTNGRGTRGRPWFSQPGNFCGTFVFRSRLCASTYSQMPFLAALAVRAALRTFLYPEQGSMLGIKPPNDVVVLGGSKKPIKIAGILAEVWGGVIYLGVGVNLIGSPLLSELELGRRDGALPAGNMLDQFGVSIQVDEFFNRFQPELSHSLAERGGARRTIFKGTSS